MKLGSNLGNNARALGAGYAALVVWTFAYVFLASLLGLGCTSTVVPETVSDARASWDGNVENSGFIGFDAAGNGVITPHARDRYNELVKIYGAAWKPPIRPDDGIRPTGTNAFSIDAEHLVTFATMNRWRKQGKAP